MIGDIVRLNSGGPKMTIAKDMGNGVVECHWFPNKRGKCKRREGNHCVEAWFHLSSLQLVKPVESFKELSVKLC